MEFRHELTVRFDDVDQAGIVYYPRFFHYYHVAFEEFFGALYPGGYSGWIAARRVGFPTVHVEADFHAPLRFGDRVAVGVTVPRVGETSIDFQFRVLPSAAGAGPAARARVTKVCVDMERIEPCPVPGELRDALGRYREAT